MINLILFFIFSYLLGSFPSGHAVTKLSTGKNVLNVGWRKTSGSNVFRHVGRWQGLATAVLDIGKSYLCVKLAQILGFSPLNQVFTALLVLIGNNWSIFLKFSGGRGLGTYGGALIAFSPIIFIFAIAFFALLSTILNSALVTFLLFPFVFYVARYYNLSRTIGTLTLFCLIPVFVKRLSPVGELFPLKEKAGLLKNRFIFDNDQARPIRGNKYFFRNE